MAGACCDHHHSSNPQLPSASPSYRRVLWVALWVNLAMFAIEIGAGFTSGSVSLLADAIDFFGDAANYGVALVVMSMGALWRSRAAMLKATSMIAFGVFVLARALWVFSQGSTPEAVTMGAIGAVALAANVGVAVMLYAWRDGDANMRSVWLCSRNDALGNMAVLLAAVGVFGTGRAWPDLAVAAVMGGLALHSGWRVMAQARQELAQQAAAPAQ